MIPRGGTQGKFTSTGKAGGEETVLKMAQAYEQSTPWHTTLLTKERSVAHSKSR